MSFDLMVFEPSAAPTERAKFMEWYQAQTEWSEDHSYQDHSVTSPALKAWFEEMINFFPPMNGPLASDDIDDEKVTDHCIGKEVIYSAFAWPVAEEAYRKMRELAIKHNVGFFDVSADQGEILFPGRSITGSSAKSKPCWKFW
ncbi:hypothetical protein [Microbulbifer rhizosphaerae]|uniref:Uncharacterized protein n=1 Tax=Microbulbifer rhizosphaerae TaxID=1562603 RepID=A0A7W4WGE0_9GAMM|nr:hypothetical protein [Microbulbifer rhizosphaerae]MBB3063693.1 hypothetical protein [Microbulbifer rhizosphaerae]